MSRTYRKNAHFPLQKIHDTQNKNNSNGVYKGDWKEDKQMGLKSFSLKKSRFIAKEKLQAEQVA